MPLKTDLLTIESATTYAANIVGTEFTLGEAIRCNMNDTDTVSIILLDKSGAEYGTMEVWVEGGRLYGEY